MHGVRSGECGINSKYKLYNFAIVTAKPVGLRIVVEEENFLFFLQFTFQMVQYFGIICSRDYLTHLKKVDPDDTLEISSSPEKTVEKTLFANANTLVPIHLVKSTVFLTLTFSDGSKSHSLLEIV